MQIAQALAKNTEMMAGLAMSFDDKLSITAQEAEEQKTMLKALGLGGLSKEEMKVTPSLRNLNQVRAKRSQGKGSEAKFGEGKRSEVQ